MTQHPRLTQHPRPVVVGSGLAGLVAARELSSVGCILITAGGLTEGTSSVCAQGGIAAAVDSADDPRMHAEDTWRAGAEAGDRAVIERITAAAPGVVDYLISLGVPFDRTPDGRVDLAREGGHSHHRIAHAGDHSGATLTAAVADAVRTTPGIDIREGHTVTRILTDDSGSVRGLAVRDRHGSTDTLTTDRVILATGGLGGLFAHTTNPTSARGQGIALAARAGARTDDLHLVQFHPTALDVDRDPMPLLTEALRGDGAVLLADGHRFVDELLPRDQVSAAVWQQLTDGHRVQMDAREVTDVRRHFPTVARLAQQAGLDIGADLLPVRPAVHYSMGGVTVDDHARTSVRGLWAIGETARTGLHGANRLASNSLLEAVVTGQAAARSASDPVSAVWDTAVPAADPSTQRRAVSAGGGSSLSGVRRMLDDACGVLRDGPTLRMCVNTLSEHTGEDSAYVGWLVARSALSHPHSVGAHRRTDIPAPHAVPHGVPA